MSWRGNPPQGEAQPYESIKAERVGRVSLHVALARQHNNRPAPVEAVVEEMAARGVRPEEAPRVLSRLEARGEAYRVGGGWRARTNSIARWSLPDSDQE